MAEFRANCGENPTLVCKFIDLARGLLQRHGEPRLHILVRSLESDFCGVLNAAYCL